MTPERWQQVKALLDAVSPLPPALRASQLEKACAQDAELRSEVESLLQSLDRVETNFLKPPHRDLASEPLSAIDTGDTTGLGFAMAPNSAQSEEELIGCRLGSYQIVRRIGAGGMGEVYRAFRADDQYRKEVAIKVVRAEKGSRFILERFRNERQILAALEHPNICRLLDGGTTEGGLPYFVMELVEGQPIDEYSRSHNLALRERLNLFLQVCSAVQYAHQCLIVHRDIKPANILVDVGGTPKLLDFGIAKILDANSAGSSAATVTLFQVLTPRYASPEQIKGDPITTASDIYSLGVVLYELLVGESPYRLPSRTPHEMGQAVCLEEPLRPSTLLRRRERKLGSGKTDGGEQSKLTRRLRGDLDNIVLMALRKEPNRRYSSVEQFASDIRRHLENLPVIARPDTFQYRSTKFVIRHKAGVAASAVAVLALIAGLGVALHEARIARDEQKIAEIQKTRAERRFNDVRKLANSLIFQLHDSIKDLPGSTPARKLLVSNALEYLDSLSKEAKSDSGLQKELAAAYEKIGDVQGQPRQANLGDPAGAADSYKKALAIRESLASANPSDLDVRRQLVPNYAKLSDLRWSAGDTAGALDYSKKGAAIAKALYDSDPADVNNRIGRARSLIDEGYKEALFGGDPVSGLKYLQQGSALLEKLVADDPHNLGTRRMLALSYSRTAEIFTNNPADQPKALTLYEKSISAKQALVAAEPGNAEFRRLVAYDQFALADLLANMGNKSAALAHDREALASFQSLAAADPQNAQLQEDIGRVHSEIGQILNAMRDAPNALREFQSSLAILEKLSDARNPKSLAGFTIAMDQLESGKAHIIMASRSPISKQERLEHCREAESWLKNCLPAFEDIRDHAPPQFGGAARVNEVKSEMNKCERLRGSGELPGDEKP